MSTTCLPQLLSALLLLASASHGVAELSFASSRGQIGDSDASGDFAINRVSSSTIGSSSGLWVAGANLLANEKPDSPKESAAKNATVPEWSYGTRAQAASTALTLFRPELHANGTSGFEGWSSSGASEGVLGVNVKDTPLVLGASFVKIFPGQLFIHPSSSNHFVVARWTAPAAGFYRVQAEWLDIDSSSGNGASGHVVINGKEVFGRVVGPDQVGPKRFVGQEWENGGNAEMPAATFKLNAGDVVDFAVGSRGNFDSDSTTFNAIVKRVPGVEITNAPPQSRTEEGVQLPEGADVTLEVAVDSPQPVASVTLLENGDRGVTDTTSPYALMRPNLAPGVYFFSVETVDSNGIKSISEQIKVRVLPNPPSAAARSTANGEKDSDGRVAAASNGGQFFVCTQSGAWSNPATWGGLGVPGRHDDVAIYPGFAVNAGDVEVKSLDLLGSLVIGSPGFPRRFVVYGQLFSNGLAQGGDPASQLVVFDRLTSVSGSTKFRDLNVIVSGTFIVTGNGGIDSTNTVLVTSGKSNVFSPPGTNRPAVVRAGKVELAGGVLKLDSYAQIIAPAGVIARDGAGLIGNDGSTLIGNDGGTLIGNDGSTLIGNDGSTLLGIRNTPLIGLDGSTLIGNDGSTLIGNDGATLIGNDGSTLIGNVGSTMVATGGSAEDRATKAATADFKGFALERATFTGSLHLIGNVLNRSGFILPGSSAGKIRVKGNYTQEAAGTLLLEVGGTQTVPLQFDQIQISGTATLGGNLIVKTIDGFTPQSGDSFAPITYGAVNGTFDSVTSNAQVSIGANGATMQVSGPNPPAPKALNIATRMRVETGDNVLIAGFIITGTQPKRVLIRGIGPSLPVAGALANPTLDLDGGAFFNDDWRSDQESEIIGTTIPPSSDLESAIVATLEPGAHTAVLRGKDDGTGVGLVEVYDLESGAPAQLANISTRGQVQAGDNVMIGGFIIAGDYPAKVLLRAIGPSLPVEGALQDPTLELVDGQGNTISNDNWRATQEAEIIATTVPPTNDREAAIVATLVPGAYTAVVRGKGDTVGVALVEGYNLQ